VYLPISTSATIFVGGAVRYVVDKLRNAKESEAEFSPGVLLSSGYIAGGAIAGVVLAFLAIPADGEWLKLVDIPHQLGTENFLGKFFNAVGESDQSSPLWSALWGLAIFSGLAVYLLRGGLTKEGGRRAD
jgi:hypothetical protein